MPTYSAVSNDTSNDPDPLLKLSKSDLVGRLRAFEEELQIRDKELRAAKQAIESAKADTVRLRKLGKRLGNVIGGMIEYARCQSEVSIETYETWEMMRVMLSELEDQITPTFEGS